VGFGLGIERLLLLLQELKVPVPSAAPEVYAILPSPAALPQAMALLEQLRDTGVAVQMHAGGGGMKSQEMVGALLNDHEALVVFLRSALETAQNKFGDAGTADFFDCNAIAAIISASATIFGADRQTQIAELAQLLKGLDRKTRILIYIMSVGRDLFGRKIADGFSYGVMFVVEQSSVRQYIMVRHCTTHSKHSL